MKLLLIFCFLLPFTVMAQPIAFPNAQGWGAKSTGGRGGTVYHVTNLNDSGAGSFRDAVSQANRMVVFDISGVIKIESPISVASKITIAGQSAPKEGITIYGNSVSLGGSDNVIVRYIRFHGSINMSKGKCTLSADNAHDIIFDHCSITWGRWDNLHIKNSQNITLQYCINGEAIDPQRFGALLESPTNLTIHHCLWIDNQSRNPKAKAGIEFINNIVYNYGANGFVGGHSAAVHYQDVINNYFIAATNSTNNCLAMFTSTDHVYHRGNYVDLNKDGILNGKLIVNADFKSNKDTTATFETAPHQPSLIAVKEESAADAYKTVLETVGASLYHDSVDLRLIQQLKSLGKEGKIIKTESEVNGQAALKSEKSKLDTDADGMPDEWEIAHGLNPKIPDNNILNKDGYTNLEVYLNSLVP